MTWRDDVIKMAREAGFVTGTIDCADGSAAYPIVQTVVPGSCLVELERFATLVTAAKQEQCAKACGDIADGFARRYGDFNGEELGANTCADVIRALKDGEECS